jgi:hypothetical protein
MTRCRLGHGALLIALVLAVCVPSIQAQDTEKNDTFWDVRQRQQAGAAAQLVLARHPLTAAVLRIEAQRYVIWDEPELSMSLNPDWLDEIKDRTGMRPLRPDLRHEHPEDWAFYMALNEALIKSARFPLEDFARRAEEHGHVTVAHLSSDPARYRGEVIPVHGILRRIRKFDVTLPAKNQGLLFLYEGWIYGPTKQANPFQVVFTSLPEGVKEAEEMNKRVTFLGYFLKINKYRTAKGEERFTPYLVGPTIAVNPEPPPPPAEPAVSAQMILMVVGVMGAALGFMVAVSWFYRRGDRRHRQKVGEMQTGRTMEMLEQMDREASKEVPDQQLAPDSRPPH